MILGCLLVYLECPMMRRSRPFLVIRETLMMEFQTTSSVLDHFRDFSIGLLLDSASLKTGESGMIWPRKHWRWVFSIFSASSDGSGCIWSSNQVPRRIRRALSFQ